MKIIFPGRFFFFLINPYSNINNLSTSYPQANNALKRRSLSA